MKILKNIILAFMLGIMPLSVACGASLDEQFVNASDREDLERMKKLLKFGANINARGYYGNTALINVTKVGKLNIVQWLVENGADINATNNDKWTAIMSISQQNGFEESQLKVVKYLVSKGADINTKDKDGNNTFMILLKSYKWDIAKFLVENGADINNKDKKGNTALMWLTQKGKLEMVKYLVSKGADLNVKNNDGETAFMIALNNGNLEIAEFLESVGADTTRE